MISLTVIVPTVGRESLEATLYSCIGADEVIVVDDCDHYGTYFIVHAYQNDEPGDWRYFELDPPLGGFGHAQRNMALDAGWVTGTHLASIDDDDVYLPGAISLVKAALADAPERWHVFGMTFGPGSHAKGIVLPRGRGLMLGEIGTPMIVAPICGARFGLEYAGDFAYAQALQAELGDPVWHDEQIALIRPEAIKDPA